MAAPKRLTCPECWSVERVEKTRLSSTGGKDLVRLATASAGSVRARSRMARLASRAILEPIHGYRCSDCGYYEIWDTAARRRLLKGFITARPSTGVAPSSPAPRSPGRITNAQKEMAHAVFIASLLTLAGFYLLSDGVESPVDHLAIIFITTVLIGCFTGFSFVILRLVDKNVHWLSSTLKLHQLLYGRHLYYLERAPRRERVTFGVSVKRALFGSLLIFGIFVIVIENFLIIPDLKQFFGLASSVTLLVLAVSLPVVMVFFYVSPLVTKEANLYYFDKKDRIVRNIGSWLDDALKFFAAIDIVLTLIIVIDSGLDASWFLAILAFLCSIFSFFIIFTVMFNRHFHARLKEKFVEFLKGNYNFPLKKATVLQQSHHCLSCGAVVDAVQENLCQACGTTIFKCEICNEVITTTNVLGKNPKAFPRPTASDKVSSIIQRMESKLAGAGSKEYPAIQCPECGILAHLDEFISWMKLHKACPGCKRELNVFDIL